MSEILSLEDEKEMFEYHGWIGIVYSPYDVEDEEQKLHAVVNYTQNPDPANFASTSYCRTKTD